VIRTARGLVAAGAALLVLAGGAHLPAQEYDPLKGMEENGRIPRQEMPEDLIHPERWRYIPEGRIKPGNILERFMISTFISPILTFDSDVGAGGGIALTDIDFRNQRRREFLGLFLTHTTEGQQKYELLWKRLSRHREMDGGGVIFEERNFFRAGAKYERTLTRRFFGLGSGTDPDDETSYLDEVTSGFLEWQGNVPGLHDDLVFLARIRGEYHNLSRGRVDDVPSTEERYPFLVEEGDGRALGWLDVGVKWDHRDSELNPYTGWMAGIDLGWAPVQRRGGSGGIVHGELQWVTPVPGLFHAGGDADEAHPPTDVLVLDLQAWHAFGDLPFWALPSLGGRHQLRGHIANRFTDENAWSAAAEYRFWFLPRGFAMTDEIRIERLGAALFVEAGSVDDSFADLLAGSIHPSAGVSLRIGLERSAVLRGDLGFGEDAVNFVFAFGMPF